MSMFLSFLGGAAEQLTTDIKQAELDAKEMAKSSFNGLYKRYEENAAANRELTNKMKAEKQYIETVWSNATPEQVNALIANPVALDAIKKAKNPESIDLKNYINVISSNESTATGAERAAMMPEIKAQIMAKMKEAKAPEGGSPIGALIRETGQQRMESDMEKYAKGQGMTLEQLRAGAQVTRPAETAKFNMATLQKEKSFDEREKDAKLTLLKAQKSGDPAAIDVAKADVMIFGNIKEMLTSDQQQFSNKVADIKNRYMFGTPDERKAAKPEYDKLMADVRAEAMAKKVGDGTEGKIPALGALNTFTSASVARAVAAKHGDLIKSKQLAIVEKADGSVGIDYIGDDIEKRNQILQTQANAAKNALSLYTDAQGKPFNRDVASVLNSYTSVVPSVVRIDGGAAPAAAGPQANANPTLSAPSTDIKSKVEAAGQRYDPTKWDYRIATDGSVQRKAK